MTKGINSEMPVLDKWNLEPPTKVYANCLWQFWKTGWGDGDNTLGDGIGELFQVSEAPGERTQGKFG